MSMRVPIFVEVLSPANFFAAVSNKKFAPVTVPTPVQNVIFGVDDDKDDGDEVEDILLCAQFNGYVANYTLVSGMLGLLSKFAQLNTRYPAGQTCAF